MRVVCLLVSDSDWVAMELTQLALSISERVSCYFGLTLLAQGCTEKVVMFLGADSASMAALGLTQLALGSSE